MEDKTAGKGKRALAKTVSGENGQKYSAIFQNSPFAVSLTKMPEGILTDVNRAFLELFEFNRDEVIGRTIIDLGIADRESRGKTIAMLERDGSVRDFEVTRYTKSGERRVLALSLDSLNIGGDKHILATIRDITARKLSGEATRQAEAMLRAVLEQMPSGVTVRDSAGCIILSNPRAEEIMGSLAATIEELLKFRAIHSDGSPFTAEDWPISRSIFSGETVHSGEIDCERSSDGSHVTLSVSSAPVRDPGGKIIAGVSIFHDITERRRFETRLRKAAEKYSTLFNNTSDGVWIHNRKGEILEVNDAYCAMSGYSREELTLMHVSELDVIETPEDMTAHFKRMMEAGGNDRFESRHRRRDGSVFDVDITALYFTKDGGRMAVFVRDITGRKRAETALAESRARQKVAEAIAAERKRFYDILEILPQMISLLTPDYRVAFANRSFREKFGEAGGRCCYEYRHGKTEPCRFCETFNVLSTGKSHSWELTTPDGSTIEAYDFPFKDAGGTQMILEMDIDVTRRRKAEKELEVYRENLEELVIKRTAELEESNKRLHDEIKVRRMAEETLRENQSRLEMVFSAIPYIIIEYDTRLRPQSANRAALKSMGESSADFSRAAVVEKLNFRKLDGRPIPPEELPASRAMQGEIIKDYEFLMTTSDGYERIFNAYAAPLHKNGRINGVLLIVRDITERKLAENALKESNRELDRFNRAMVGREARMIELKKEVNDLCERAGLEQRYPLEFETQD